MIHLHVHSEYSQLDGLGKPEQYIKRAKELNMPAIAVTDHGNIDAAIKWQKACFQAGIKPIIGCELYIVPNMKVKEKGERRGHITLLVKNQDGWQALLKMLTIANTEGFYYRPRIDYDVLWDKMNDGLIMLSGCSSSFLTLPGGVKLFLDLIEDGCQGYLEVMPHKIDSQLKMNKIVFDVLKDNHISLVATNDCHYVLKNQSEAQEVLLAIQRKAKWTDPDRWKFGFDGLHLRSKEEMEEAFEIQGQLSKRQYLSALTNTYRIAEQCWDFRIEKQKPCLPITKYQKEFSNLKPIEILNQFCDESKVPKDKNGSWCDIYWARYYRELDLIERKGFAEYFLIVYEIIQFCKAQGIGTGPRGSVGGSLVAYLTGITPLDPIKYDLLFERFISEDRIDLPDIDIDFDRNKVEQVRAHLQELYGEYNVAGISTFMSMKSRAAVRDVCRVFDVPLKEVDIFSKSIPSGEEKGIQIASKSSEGQNFVCKYSKQFELACQLEGQVRGSGQHPAGLIISGQDFRSSNRCNLSIREGVVVVNWDMADCEYMGLVKIDVLKLGTLSVLEECKRLINESQKIEPSFWFHPESSSYFVDRDVFSENVSPLSMVDNIDFEFEKINLEDEEVFKMLSRGQTAGVFQLTGYATTKLCKEMKINSFNDIVAVVALSRPGPLVSGMTEKYIKRKHGLKWKPFHLLYENITSDTFGVMVYQEQMMRAMIDLAGMSGNDADRIRKVIGKKRDPKEFEPYRLSFLQGCKDKKTLTEAQAESFWQGLLEWAHYGFNKCLSGDTLLFKSSWNNHSGRYISLKDLYFAWNQNNSVGAKYRNSGLMVLQMDADGKCRPGRVIGVFYQGKKKILKIQTESGKKIKATFNHRLLTFEGYKKVEELIIGDRLAVMADYQQSIYQKKGQRKRVVDTKGRMGFQEGEKNPSYIDGRTKQFKNSCIQVEQRSKGYCEKCNKERKGNARFEFAHIKSFSDCANNYLVYHDSENILYLCNSCHKKFDYEKGERKKRFSIGYSIYYDKIISIVAEEQEEDVFDVEMEKPFHNFIANGIVSHNSHAVAYALIAYWTAYVKTYYFTEFFCAALTYGEEKDKQELIQEAQNKGIQIVTPKVGISEAFRWKIYEDRAYMPFMEVKGIGQSQAEKCEKMVEVNKTVRQKGFFNLKKIGAIMGVKDKALVALLQEIKAFDLNPTSRPLNLKEYFQFIFK